MRKRTIRWGRSAIYLEHERETGQLVMVAQNRDEDGPAAFLRLPRGSVEKLRDALNDWLESGGK